MSDICFVMAVSLIHFEELIELANNNEVLFDFLRKNNALFDFGSDCACCGSSSYLYRVAQNKIPTRQYAISLQPVVRF